MKRRDKFAVTLMLLCWALLMAGLGRRSLWVDELFTAELTGQTPWGVILRTAADLHPPLYFLTLRSWCLLAGQSDFALRFPSTMAGLLAVALLYHMGRTWLDEARGLMAAAMLGLAPFFVQYARMARYYSSALLLGLLSCHLWWLLANRTGRGKPMPPARKWKLWAGYICVSLLALYTYYPTFSLLVAQGLLALRRRLWRAWLSAQGLVLAAFAPWLAVMAGQASRAAGGIPADFARSLKGLALSLAYPLYSFGLGETIFPWHPVALTGMGAVAVLFVLGLASLRQEGKAAFALLLLGLPIVATAVIITYIAVGTPFLNAPGRAMLAAPFLYLIMASGLTKLGGRARALAFLLLASTWTYALVNYYLGRQFHNPIYLTPAKEMVAQVVAQSRPGDVIVSDWDSAFGYYYEKTGHPVPHFFSHEREAARAFIEKEHPSRVWLVTLGRDRTRLLAPTDFIAWLEEDYHLEASWGYVEQDPLYRRLKEKLLRRPAYRYRATVSLYRRTTAQP